MFSFGLLAFASLAAAFTSSPPSYTTHACIAAPFPSVSHGVLPPASSSIDDFLTPSRCREECFSLGGLYAAANSMGGCLCTTDDMVPSFPAIKGEPCAVCTHLDPEEDAVALAACRSTIGKEFWTVYALHAEIEEYGRVDLKRRATPTSTAPIYFVTVKPTPAAVGASEEEEEGAAGRVAVGATLVGVLGVAALML